MRKVLPALAVVFFVGLQSPVQADQASFEGRAIMGWLESIRLQPANNRVRAKLDSGAKSNAIHAENVEIFERDGEEWVSFTLRAQHNDQDSRTYEMERPLVRKVNIKLRNTTAVDTRAAVSLAFCMDGKQHESVFTLADRTGFNYPVLLGRDFLQDRILIDPSQTYINESRCLTD